MRLILFDVDGTLISTGGAGIRAMERAGRSLFGSDFGVDGIEFAGRLDPLIIADLLTRHGVKPGPGAIDRFRAAYAQHLGHVLAESEASCPLPGVETLLTNLAARADICLGLLTGNYETTGRVKLGACGLDVNLFRMQVWGDHSPGHPPARARLPAVAMARFSRLHGEAIPAERVWIVGDTPHDVACARANGCRSLAVATGRYTEAALNGAGADAVMPNLADTPAILRIMRLEA